MSHIDPRRATLFKRFETDEEFVARLRAAFTGRYINDFGALNYKKGEDLDDYAWSAAKMQRRLVDDQTGKKPVKEDAK